MRVHLKSRHSFRFRRFRPRGRTAGIPPEAECWPAEESPASPPARPAKRRGLPAASSRATPGDRELLSRLAYPLPKPQLLGRWWISFDGHPDFLERLKDAAGRFYVNASKNVAAM